MTQNVVTYTVVVTTDNSSVKLLPYLTATLRFEVGRCTNALLVPNAALRWVGPQPAGKPIKPAGSVPSDRGTIWVLEKGELRPSEVRTGLTDGILTEVVEGELHEGQVVVVGQKSQAGGAGTVSPFTPNIVGGKK
jgi:HlyD family secretion protein